MRDWETARKNLDRRLNQWRFKERLAVPPKGWVRAIRDALGISSTELAKRMGLAQSRITAIEDSERRSAATLKTMRKVAAALDCDFVYALVPRVPLQKIAAARARVVAEKYLRDVHHTMQLENQAISPRAKQELLNRVMQELMENPRRLWSRDG